MVFQFKALRIREQYGEKSDIATSLSNIGVLYSNQHDTANALSFFKRANEINIEIKNYASLGNTSNNIGTIYLDKNQNDSAQFYYEIALDNYTKVGNGRGIAVALQNLESVQNNLKNYKNSLEYYAQAQEVLIQINDNISLSSLYLNIGRSYISLKDFYNAKINLDKGLKIACEINSQEWIKTAYRNYYEMYNAMGNYKEALIYHEQYVNLKDSLFNLETNNQLLEIEKKYETEKKEKEIITLSTEVEQEKTQNELNKLKIKQNELATSRLTIGIIALIIVSGLLYILFVIKKKSNEKLTLANDELEIEKQNIELKALKAQINPHFIFNSLNSIQKHIMDNSKELAQEYLIKFGKIMRSTLENSEEKAIPINDEKELLEMYVELEAKRLKNGINFKIIIDENIDIYNLIIPPMLLQPFIENSIKHGIANLNKKGEINLKMEQDEENIVYTITDNGIGRSASALQKEKSVQTKHRSMGMEITQNRLRNIWKKYGEQHEIQIADLTDDAGKPLGTSVKLILPLEF
jgi:tetratricopeptide (TPR) repeat protein